MAISLSPAIWQAFKRRSPAINSYFDSPISLTTIGSSSPNSVILLASASSFSWSKYRLGWDGGKTIELIGKVLDFFCSLLC
jgi:hypothetical protein